ncbi:MAG TPA: LysM peptidoglycan-binding domain-containing protein [Verrucomicrobiae bacterium]|nr:LysM peptidoglycan-binding domain-containing protein [Verrucomicrobiae bacterium]
MTFFGCARCAIVVALCLGLCGCFPPADSASDETKEPHFITGKNLIEQMDWQGAVSEFEKSLEVNPESASAHFELGWLYEGKLNPSDPAAAIYHYQQFLKLRPASDKGDFVKQHINNCKMDLVKTMSAVGPLPSGAQRELDRVVGENRDLQNQVAQLQSQIADLKTQLKAATAAAAAAASARTASSSDNSGETFSTPHVAVSRNSSDPVRTETHHHTNTVRTETPTRVSIHGGLKTHTVKPRETMASIAREYGISLVALEEANPQVRPSHLLVGATLRIPAP